MSLIGAVVKQSVDKASQTPVFQAAVENAVYKCLDEPQLVNDVEIRTISTPARTVTLAKALKNEVCKRSLEEAKI